MGERKEISLAVPTDHGETILVFNLANIRELEGVHTNLVFGGPPNSGKSTLVKSFKESVKRIIIKAEQEGFLTSGETDIANCDLDLASPTLNDITGKAYRLKMPIDDERVMVGQQAFWDETRRRTITLGDLPGGDPDSYTYELMRYADAGVLVHRRGIERVILQAWKTPFLIRGFPDLWADIRTNREVGSKLLSFKSTLHGDAINRFRAVIGGLNRTIREDPVIDAMAHAYVLDYLPTVVQIRR